MANHRYWRIRITRTYVSGAGSHVYAHEVEFRNGAGVDQATGGVASASSTVNGTPAGAFDDNLTTLWATLGNTSINGMDTTLSYDFGAGNEKDIRAVSWLNTAAASRNPRDMNLEYSDDNVNWSLQYAWTDAPAGVANTPSVYTVATPLEANEIAGKAGFHVVSFPWSNEQETAMKAGYQIVVDRPGINVEKSSYFAAIGPTDGGKIASTLGYIIYDEKYRAKVAGVTGYVLYRPLPVPPRKTVVITARGVGFGGSGTDNPLAGAVVQEQAFDARLRLPQNLAGATAQDSTFDADLFVDDSTEDIFLIGALSQDAAFSASMMIPHNLAGSFEQESETFADLTVEEMTEDHFLVGAIEQTSDIFGAMAVTKKLVGSISQTSTVVGNIAEAGPADTSYWMRTAAPESTLTGFPIRIDFSMMPNSFWDKYETGKLRVYNRAGTQLPLDVVDVNQGTKTGVAFFKADSLSSTGVNDFELRLLGTPLDVPPTAPTGRNAVWSDYEAMFSFADLEDRTGNNGVMPLQGGATTSPYAPNAVSPAVNAHQGVAWDAANSSWLVIDTAQIKRYDASWNLLSSTTNALAATGIPNVNHFGDGTVYNGELFIVLEKYTNNPYNNQHITVWDPVTLAFKRSYDISAQLHEVSSIAIVNDVAYITEYTSPGASRLHKYNILDGSYLGAQAHSGSIPSKQGIAYHNGALFVTCASKRLYRIDMTTWEISEQWAGSISGYMEGITSNGTNLYILFDGSPSAIYTFVATAGDTSYPGWLKLTGAGNGRLPVSRRTQWTFGVSYIPNVVNSNGTLLSYSTAITGTTTRASLVVRNTARIGFWNSTNTWLASTSPLVVGTRYRSHAVQDGATQRYLYHQGVLAGQSNTAQRPGGTTEQTYLYVGAESEAFSERFNGALNYAYIYKGVLSAAWIAAEFASWETPSAFATIYDHDPATSAVSQTAQSYRLSNYANQNGADSGTYSVAELTFFDAAGVRIPTTGCTFTANANWGGAEVPASAFDNNMATHWAGERGTGSWLAIQFPSPVTIYGFEIGARNSDVSTTPGDFVLEKLVDGVWVPIARPGYPERVVQNADLTRKYMFSHRMWRLLVSATGTSSFGVQDVEFRSVAGVAETNGAAGGEVVQSRKTTSFTEGGEKAFDGLTSTNYWVNGSEATPPYRLGYIFPTKKQVAQLAILPRPSALTQAPVDFMVQYSDDLGITYQTVKIFTGVTWPTSAMKLFDLPTT